MNITGIGSAEFPEVAIGEHTSSKGTFYGNSASELFWSLPDLHGALIMKVRGVDHEGLHVTGLVHVSLVVGRTTVATVLLAKKYMRNRIEDIVELLVDTANTFVTNDGYATEKKVIELMINEVK